MTCKRPSPPIREVAEKSTTLMPPVLALVILSIALTWSGCYSFKGFSIAPEIETFYVARFQNQTTNAPATIDQIFVEALKEKVSRESRLDYTDTDPDIEFRGSIRGYSVTAVAPQPGETTAFNRLEITIQIQYVNNQDEEKNWNQSFRHFEDFPSDQNLLDVQDNLVELIFDQIIEDIFNKAFTNW